VLVDLEHELLGHDSALAPDPCWWSSDSGGEFKQRFPLLLWFPITGIAKNTPAPFYPPLGTPPGARRYTKPLFSYARGGSAALVSISSASAAATCR